MDTKPLERFATWARRELITVVDAQASAVLGSGSVSRTERPDAVRRLEFEIERHGRQHVVDKVAYTWFNRIIALRFMDARDYTDAGVVSPAKGQEHGQPEILADAKRGSLDREVITSSRTADAILGLLDGTRHSTDAEGEAYALLLTEYCRFWYKSMPFMFEREGDYTELLVPANLLADGAILSRAREALTEVVCEDVEVIGWLYQFYISERKVEVFDGFKKNKKAGADEIPAATQLFTPHWIVRYLVENSLGRLWMLNRPKSRLVDQMEYYIVADDETDILKISEPQELTVMDPACGSGHMLAYAFDLLYSIYEEEGYSPSEIPGLILTHNLYGAEVDPRAGALAAFALTMKARAKQRNFFSKHVELKICVIEPISFEPDELDLLVTKEGNRHTEEEFWNQFEYADTLGSLIQPDAGMSARAASALTAVRGNGDILYGRTLEHARKVVVQAELLSRKYSVVVANPPYMGGKNMDARLASFAKENFPNTKSDLFAMFIERSLDFLRRDGYVGLMTPFVWMFISTYAPLRERLISQETISSLVQLEYSGFDGATVPICAYVLRRGGTNAKGAFVRLSEFVGPAVQGPKALEIIAADRAKREGGPASGMARHLYRLAAKEFTKIPGVPIVYWVPEQIRGIFRYPQLGTQAAVKKGLDTGSNEARLRLWYEVSSDNVEFDSNDAAAASKSSRRWYPMNKGGDRRRWYGNQQVVIDWQHNGAMLRRLAERRVIGAPTIRNRDFYFRESVGWTMISSSEFSVRYYPSGFVFGSGGGGIYVDDHEALLRVLGLLNSVVMSDAVAATTPTLNFDAGPVSRFPVASGALSAGSTDIVRRLVDLHQDDWNRSELSWGFRGPEILSTQLSGVLEKRVSYLRGHWQTVVDEVIDLESSNNALAIEAYDLGGHLSPEPRLANLTLSVFRPNQTGNVNDPGGVTPTAEVMIDLVSYAVGCTFGRYSLDEQGLILADQGAMLQDYLAKIPSPVFRPDADNVIPFVDDGWFEDDIVERFRQFLRAAFGAEHFEENLRFVEESLGVNSIRDYFITKNGKSKFYDDHVQRYKKRPIYWMFSSSKGSFNALIYMHRYNPSTVSTVLNEYLREYRAKLEV
ncbi:MAG: BREX-1 system adenine-specific DNA-methyltransferase PglX, partial [Leucobacter sp.]